MIYSISFMCSTGNRVGSGIWLLLGFLDAVNPDEGVRVHEFRSWLMNVLVRDDRGGVGLRFLKQVVRRLAEYCTSVVLVWAVGRITLGKHR